jgi:hypothetical protein
LKDNPSIGANIEDALREKLNLRPFSPPTLTEEVEAQE